MSRDFLLLVFFMNQIPPAAEYSIKIVQIFSKIRGDLRKSRCITGINDTGGKFATVSMKPAAKLPPVSTTPAAIFPPVSLVQICHRCQRRWWRQIATGINDTSSKFATDVNNTSGKSPPVLMAANLPPVSTVANNRNNYQTADNVKINKTKIFLYANSTTQRCPKEIMKIFLIEDFFYLPPVSTTPMVHLELRISLRIFTKSCNDPSGLIRGLGETDPCRKPKVKNLVTLSH